MLTFFLCHYLIVFQNYITDYNSIFSKFMSFEYLPELGTKINDLDTPALVIDLDLVESNLSIMQNAANKMNINLRPHSKTHKSTYWAKKQITLGAIGICCAKIGEAEIMSRSGVDNILIANQIIGHSKIERLISIAKMSNVIVACDSEKNIRELSMASTLNSLTLGVLVEINVGQNRCGIDPVKSLEFAKLIDTLPGLTFKGIMGYEGHIVGEKDYEIRSKKARESMKFLQDSVEIIKAGGLKCEIVSAAGTGTYSFSGSVKEVTELQCGSYIFMDGDYMNVMDDFDSALFLLTSVISNNVHNQIVVDCGLKSISVDRGLANVITPNDAEIVKHSEEHTIISTDGDLEIGDKVRLLPQHGDTTINLHDFYFGVRNGKLETIIPIDARGKFR